MQIPPSCAFPASPCATSRKKWVKQKNKNVKSTWNSHWLWVFQLLIALIFNLCKLFRKRSLVPYSETTSSTDVYWYTLTDHWKYVMEIKRRSPQSLLIDYSWPLLTMTTNICCGYCLLNICWTLNIVINICTYHLIYSLWTLRSKYSNHPYCANEVTEAQRGLLSCYMSHSMESRWNSGLWLYHLHL